MNRVPAPGPMVLALVLLAWLPAAVHADEPVGHASNATHPMIIDTGDLLGSFHHIDPAGSLGIITDDLPVFKLDVSMNDVWRILLGKSELVTGHTPFHCGCRKTPYRIDAYDIILYSSATAVNSFVLKLCSSCNLIASAAMLSV